MKHIPSLLLLFLACFAQAQSCSPDSLRTHEVRASKTDPNITIELAKHFAWYNPTCPSNNLLLVHLVGTIDNPRSTTYFPALAANNGFHAVSLKYPNGTSAQSPCRNSADSSCFENFRKEIIEGIDYSPDIQVDASDCIYNRLVKLLQYLHAQNPAEGWDAYLTGDAIHWSQLALSGHSQGGGHAALIAKDHEVNRVIMFASPNDYSAHFNDAAFWAQQPHLTPTSAYYAFGNLYDDIVDAPEQFLHWNKLGLASLGDSLRIQGANCPFDNTHQLYTTDDIPGLAVNHSLMIRDKETPLDSAGKPVYENVWKYLLGIPCGGVGIEEEFLVSGFEFRVYPNPADALVMVSTYGNTSLQTHVEIFNSQGQLLVRQTMTSSDVEIDLSRFPKGMLFVKIFTDGKQTFHCMKLVHL